MRGTQGGRVPGACSVARAGVQISDFTIGQTGAFLEGTQRGVQEASPLPSLAGTSRALLRAHFVKEGAGRLAKRRAQGHAGTVRTGVGGVGATRLGIFGRPAQHQVDR